MINSLWELPKKIIFTFEFWGAMLMQAAIISHFHFSFMETTLLGGGCGLFLSNYLTKKDRPIIIDIKLPTVSREDRGTISVQ